MPRQARIIIPHVPHHVTQRGNRRQRCFFRAEDYNAYKKILAISCEKFGVQIIAYCLMPNHIHLIAVPEQLDSLRLAIGSAHERYTRMINVRQGWQGYLWQGRFFSCPMDERYTVAAGRYIEQNPVRAGLCSDPVEYYWSSARVNCLNVPDDLVQKPTLSKQIGDWQTFISGCADKTDVAKIRQFTRRGRFLR